MANDRHIGTVKIAITLPSYEINQIWCTGMRRYSGVRDSDLRQNSRWPPAAILEILKMP